MARIILEINHVRKSYGDRELFFIPSLRVYEGERVGLIGQNGAGKSTLLCLLGGEAEPDEGTVRRFGRTALIHQQGAGEETGMNGEFRSLFRAGQAHEGRSGGELTRGRIAAALSQQPNLLLADEPTTDLDASGMELLYRQLEAYSGALILISHDRTMLERLCTRIWHLENRMITDFPGGYSMYREERERRRTRAQFEYDQYRKEQERLKESARRMAERAASVRKAPSRMGNSEARLHTREYTNSVLHLSHMKRTLQNRMEQMERKERPTALPEIRMKLGVQSPIEAKTALELQCESLSVGGSVLLEDTGMILPTGSRTGLTGDNGCGKTTLLSALTGELPREAVFRGTVRLNPKAKIGWFDQHHERTLDPDRTVLENVTAESVHPQALARTVLSCLGFAREDAFKPVSILSGGEKAKTALARLMLMDLNLLILDEPTNHLDLFTMEELEELLAGYGGTLLFVSHDRAFLDRVADRRIRFENRKLITQEGAPQATNQMDSFPGGMQDTAIERMKLEMRMADLSGRMARPKKGDRPDRLQEEYMQLAEKIRRLREMEKQE